MGGGLSGKPAAWLDAEGNLRFALGTAYDASLARSLLCELGLGDAGKKKARDYSGGMQRRLALARALLAPSDALALDEPFTGLDLENREAALRAILRAAETKIVLLSTHEELSLWALTRLCLLTLRGNSAYHDFTCVITFSGRG